MAETNASNINFEKQIYNAACDLLGNQNTSEYKSVIFLKYISYRLSRYLPSRGALTPINGPDKDV